jgi:hypothetical protein
MKQRVTLDNLQLVPEDIIQYCADQIADDDQNSFKRILGAAHEFKNAGLTPVFLCSETLKDVFVTTAEKLQKKLH